MTERFTSHVVEGGVRVFTDNQTGEKFVDGQRGRAQNTVDRDPSQMSQGTDSVSQQVGHTEFQAVGILDSQKQQG